MPVEDCQQILDDIRLEQKNILMQIKLVSPTGTPHPLIIAGTDRGCSAHRDVLAMKAARQHLTADALGTLFPSLLIADTGDDGDEPIWSIILQSYHLSYEIRSDMKNPLPYGRGL